MQPNKIFVVIPAFNEGKHVAKVVQSAKRFANKVIVVDNGSFDNTSEEAKKGGFCEIVDT